MLCQCSLFIRQGAICRAVIRFVRPFIGKPAGTEAENPVSY